MKFKSNFAVLDVLSKKPRKALIKRFAQRPIFGPCPKHLRIPIVIHGYIDGINSNHDGTSQEFSVHVAKVDVTA